jgi:ABC-type uncharacterized transport system substrate-binding protein
MIMKIMQYWLLALALCTPLSSHAQNDDSTENAPPITTFSIKPTLKPGGQKWRIGYFQSGDYRDYPQTLREIVKGLERLGWLSIPNIPPELTGQQVWEFIAAKAHSDTLKFVADAYWQPGNFEKNLRPIIKKSISDRLTSRHDIDLIIAMGTWAGQDIASLGAPVPTLVASVSDAVNAHIVASAEDSGLDNLHARVQPERYQRQVRLFHEIVPFKTLGLVYEDNLEGRTYAAVPAVEQVAREAGFKVLSCNAPADGIPLEQATRNAIACYEKLAPQVDAVYVTTHRGITHDSVGKIAAILRKARVPSFSMLGSEEVEKGILVSLAQADNSYVGLFYAETIARIFNGAKPRELSQIWVDPPKIALNLQTARIIGFDPPIDVLLASDEVYQGQ